MDCYTHGTTDTNTDSATGTRTYSATDANTDSATITPTDSPTPLNVSAVKDSACLQR